MAKIHHFKLLLLSIISLICVGGFAYYDSLPDHYLVISSNSDSSNIVLYFLTSVISGLVYYVGPWIFAPTLLYFLIFSFFINKRNNYLDLLVAPLLLLMVLPPFTYYGEKFLGVGLINFYGKTINLYLSFLICFSSFFLLMRILFEKFIIYRFNFLKNIPSYFNDKLPSLNVLNVASEYVLDLFSKLKGSTFAKNISTDVDIETKVPDDYSLITTENTIKPELNSPIKFAMKEKVKTPLPKLQIKNRATRSKANSDANYFKLITNHSEKRKRLAVNGPDADYFDKIVKRIEEKLAEFKIDGQIINILKGPVVDTFELELGTGVKVSKVTSSSEDLSMALYGAPIRIVYPMRGRTTVGIEVPRNPREIIFLDEILTSKEFMSSRHNLPLAMGKDAFGQPFIVDLSNMPHMLVAGATGAGKSVFINTILVSLLVKKTPNQMKLILIDPKQLELALYSSLPHLIMPVVTEAKIASISLLWAVQEMERRYGILKEFGVRNIEGFNEKLKSSDGELLSKIQHFYSHDEKNYELPHIVIIVDEFADLILTKAGKEIENNICRLAAKARAAGIHLVIATQRPSVDVITGLIKSNFPTRVSFRVTTSIDSRTILNTVGAERLLGKGDMLYKHGVETVRVHSSFVDEIEIEKLTYNLSEFGSCFDPEVLEFIESGGDLEKDPYSFGSHIPALRDEDGESDDLFGHAVDIVTECRSASASMLQRRLKIGYNRAANLVELMERKGIVGPAQGSKPRKVLHAPK